MDKLQRVLIMAGGTGGHVFPGLAVAKHMREQGIDVQWLGTPQGLEAQIVPEAGFPIHFISISGLRGKNWKTKLLAPWRLMVAILQALRIIWQLNPNIILGMGGFASGPGGVAAWLLRKKLIIHEQNAKSGLTNRMLAKLAEKVLEGFPNTFSQQRNKVLTIGNPLRKEIALLPSPQHRFSMTTGRDFPHKMRLLVLGGSLGAQAINQLLPRALMNLPENLCPVIYHQTGEKHFSDTVVAYKNAKITAEIVPFIKEMDKAYAWADVVVCRSGALTIAELCAAGLGAILIPYPYAVDDHQTANANFMVKQQAALLVQQVVLTENVLAQMLEELCHAPEKCRVMAEAAYRLRKVDATEKVLEVCISCS